MNFGSKILARYAQCLLRAAHIASNFVCLYYATAGTIVGTTDVYELGFSYLSISIFISYHCIETIDAASIADESK